MIDFIPLEYYTLIYYLVAMLVVFSTYVYTTTTPILSVSNTKYNQLIFIFFLFTLFYIGLRPISGKYFVDMRTYANIFEAYQNYALINTGKDIYFHKFMSFMAKIISVEVFFLLCAFLYIYPLYLISKKWFKDYWFYAFLMLATAFSFWAYGTNGIRNGIAGSLFLLGISRDKNLWKVVWIVIAIGFHKSMLLPTLGYGIAYFYNKPKVFLSLWLFSIPLSLVAGGFWESLFESLGFEDERMAYFTAEVDEEKFSSKGFRWDFLLYSATAVALGWYYIFKRNFQDNTYFLLFNTYLFANAFWILVIRANFSNRFAYLSWFMIALVACYPLLKEVIIPNQHKKIGLLIVGYFSISFLLSVILK